MSNLEGRPGDDTMYFLAAALLYGAVIFALIGAIYVLAQGLWRPFDIQSYYGLADSAVRAAGPYFGTDARPLLQFTLPYWGSLSGLAIVGLIDLSCALLVRLIGMRLYDRKAGTLAGLLFAVNLAWAQGYFTLAEPLALLLVLSSAYALLCADGEARFLLAGLCAGAAICLKPLLVLLVPAALLAMHLKKERGGAVDYAAAAFLAALILAGLAFLLSGAGSLSSLGVSISYAGSFRSSDALAAVADIALSVVMLATLLPLAIMGYARIERGPAEAYFLLAGLLLMGTFVFREYGNYWLFALPFLALLCACYRRPAHGA